LQLAVLFEICLIAYAGILAHQQVVFVAEVPGKASEFIAFGVGDARQAEIECTRFNQLPDTGACQHACGDFTAAPTDQLVSNILVDTAVCVG
jgi:hypothetical protein